MFQSASEPKPGRNNRISPVLPPNLVSNPRPSRSPDETLHFDGSEACLESFNPRPSRSPDETRNPILHHQLNRVSIRVRAEARTKQGSFNVPADNLRVSIRVRAEARTKRYPVPVGTSLSGFNPRPSRSPDETLQWRRESNSQKFQSASEPKPGRNASS